MGTVRQESLNQECMSCTGDGEMTVKETRTGISLYVVVNSDL